MLINGNCLQAMDQIDDQSIDLILTDPPYGMTAQKWDQVIDYDKLWIQYDRIIKKSGAVLLFAKPPFDKLLAGSNIKNYRYDWVWEKSRATGFLNAEKMPLQASEYILVFYKSLPDFNPQKSQGHKPVNGFKNRSIGKCYNKTNDKVRSGGGSTERYPRNVVKFAPVPNLNRFHSNQKPVDLLEFLIKSYSKEGQTILDSTMGSGSTGIACRNTNRKFVGIEQDPEIYKIAEKRISDLDPASLMSQGAFQTHAIRTKATEKKLKKAIKELKQTGIKATQSAAADLSGVSRGQINRKYKYLFECV